VRNVLLCKTFSGFVAKLIGFGPTSEDSDISDVCLRLVSSVYIISHCCVYLQWVVDQLYEPVGSSGGQPFELLNYFHLYCITVHGK